MAIIDPGTAREVAANAVRAGLPSGSAPAFFSHLVDGQAVMLATNDFYAWATVLMVASIGVVWLVKRPKGALKSIAH